LAQSLGVDKFSVFSDHEAYRVWRVKKGRIKLMIMGSIENDNLPWAIANNIEIYAFELDRLRAIIKTAKKLNKKAILHIEVETGMNRTGFDTQEFPEVIHLLKENEEFIRFEGLCTHYAGAESVSNYVRV